MERGVQDINVLRGSACVTLRCVALEVPAPLL